MALLDSIKSKINAYILKKGVAKGAKAAALFIASFIASSKVQGLLSQYGISINLDPVVLQTVIGGLLMQAGTMLLNFLKLSPKEPEQPK